MDLATASIEEFEPLLDHAFSVDVEDVGPLILTQAERRPRHQEGGREPFVLVFRSNDSNVLEQRIYRLQHESTGPLDIFLVPIAQGKAHVLYEAIFN